MAASLRPMTEDEFARWLPAARDAYAKEIARNGDGDEGAARRLAGEESEQLFPGGRPSADQCVPRTRRGDADTGAWLNVFGNNDVGRSLYRSLGYEENAVFMTKAV